MFDTDKIHRIAKLLMKIPNEFDNVYVIHDGLFVAESAALFRRLKIPVAAIMSDTAAEKELWGFPVVKTVAASANFNERTALIILSKKPVPLIQTTFDFTIRGGVITVPAFVMTNEEAAAIYDRLILKGFIDMYAADGITDVTKTPSALAQRFARGLTTFLHPNFQDFKYQLWDRREHFKPTYDFDDAAIVIQGPIAYDNNYTVETFKLYRLIYPNVPIVVSTWKGEATNDFRKACRENSIVLLENEMPKERGLLNENMQIRSSYQGVKYLRENTGVKFVLKTRTDQRINRCEFLVYFKNLLETFPPNGDKLNLRIIFLNSPVSKFWPFYINDFLAFGHVEDIFKLYDIPLHYDSGEIAYAIKHVRRRFKIRAILRNPKYLFDYNSVTEQNHKLYKLNKMINRWSWAEVYIARTFYEKHIAPIDENKLLETNWKFIHDYLILIDLEAILWDWAKYEDRRYVYSYFNESNFAFGHWLDMYRNFKIDWV